VECVRGRGRVGAQADLPPAERGYPRWKTRPEEVRGIVGWLSFGSQEPRARSTAKPNLPMGRDDDSRSTSIFEAGAFRKRCLTILGLKLKSIWR
jgi:hypothetical protein